MKNFYTFLIAVLVSGLGFGQGAIDFDTSSNWNPSPSGYGNYTYTDGLFTATGVSILRNGTSNQDGVSGAFGTYSVRLRNNSSASLTMIISSGGAGTFSMKVRRWDGSPATNFAVETTTDNGVSWNASSMIDASITTDSNWKTINGTINSTNANVGVRIVSNGTTERLMVDDFSWTAFTSGPDNPDALSASASSSSQIDLPYQENGNGDDIVIVFDTDNTFTTPTGAPTAPNTSFAGGTVLVQSTSGNSTYNHTGLTEGTTYYYMAYSYDGTDYSSGIDATATTPCTTTTLFPITEGFEGGALPLCWSQEFDTANNISWIFTSDGDAGGSGTSNSAYNGSLNALISNSSTTPDVTKLITPPLDISSLPIPTLTFWHTQEIWGSDQDELRIYYKTSAAGSWTLIPSEAYTSSLPDWEQKTITLPDPSAEYYIAFEATVKFGRGVALDDIEIKEGTSSDANIIASSFNEPDNINYIDFDDVTSGLDDTNAVKIGEFILQDAGGAPADADDRSITLTDITFNIAGFENIAAIALIDDTTPILSTYMETSVVTASTSFSGLTINAADNDSKTFSVYVTFDNTNITDNEQIQLTISAATADAIGSTFAASDAGGVLTSIAGDNNRIEVTATNLIFDQGVSNTEINAIMSPSPTVTAVDDEVNTDLDALNITLTSSTSGIFSIAASSVETTVAGTATFDNLSFDTVGTGYTLTASSGTLITDTSSAFNVTDAVPQSGATDLFFSEYIEGSSNNKYLEIYNGTGVAVTLTDYSVELYANGGSSPSNTEDFTGPTFPTTLADGAVIVLQNSSATIYGGTAYDASVCNFNGDDTIVLKKNGVILDIIGNIGCDPGSDWSANNNDTSDETLVRNADICGGVTTNPGGACGGGSFPTLGTEWTNFSQNNVSNLGSHTANCGVALTCNTFEGNGLSSFNGAVGNGSLEVCATTDPTIDFTFTKSADPLTNILVIYIDSKAGGITTTTNLTDGSDGGRRAISGFDGGTQRSIVTFPPGFQPDYAITVEAGFSGVFELVENGMFPFVDNANQTVSGNDYSFDVNFSELGTTLGSESFKLLATYVSSTGYRSDETIGRSNASGGDIAYTPITFETYFQANNGLQGGEAPSTASGNWSDNVTWTNGNAPLTNDEVTIVNDVTQDVDYNANSISINGSSTLTVNVGQVLSVYNNSLDTNDGISGTGNLNVNGKLVLTEGGFTDVIPTYSAGSTLEYRNVLGTYNRFSEWGEGLTVGAGVPDNVIIENASLDLTDILNNLSDQEFNIGTDLTLLSNGNLNVDATKSLTLGSNLSNTGGTVTLNSTSEDYSSLIVGGSSTGDVTYKRHVNTFNSTANSTTGQNDLISAPVTNASQTFGAFRAHIDNTNIPSGNIGGVPSFLFGPFDNNADTYVNFNASNDGDVLTAGIGYRTASTNTSTFTFVGDVETSAVSVGISIGTGSIWNLIGNPYTSYIDSNTFLTENMAALDADAVGIYGYDGTAQDDWTILNFNTTNSTNYKITPGQGFLVAAEGTATLNFTPAMRTVEGDDDFIVGRMDNEFLSLKIESGDASYHTDFYFNANSTRALDPGYDAAIFDNALPALHIYSHLVENNTGRAMAIQSLGSNDLSEITIPLGVNALQSNPLNFTVDTSSLSTTTQVYLEDNVANTFTLLNAGDYTLTPNEDLSGTGRFFLRFTNNVLSTPENNLNNLNIYTDQANETVVISGQLIESTSATIYDLQGRVVISTALVSSSRSQSINVSALSTGVYVVQLQNGTQNKTQKVIIR